MIPLCRITGRKIEIGAGLPVVSLVALWERADAACRGRDRAFRDRVMAGWRNWLWA